MHFQPRYCAPSPAPAIILARLPEQIGNVSPLVRGAEMRVAETRAVNRALRKAYGIGICSVEEIGSLPARSQPEPNVRKLPPPNGNGEPKPRDQPSSAKPRRIRLGADAYRGNSIELGLHASSPWYAPSGPIRGKPGTIAIHDGRCHNVWYEH